MSWVPHNSTRSLYRRTTIFTCNPLTEVLYPPSQWLQTLTLQDFLFSSTFPERGSLLVDHTPHYGSSVDPTFRSLYSFSLPVTTTPHLPWPRPHTPQYVQYHSRNRRWNLIYSSLPHPNSSPSRTRPNIKYPRETDSLSLVSFPYFIHRSLVHSPGR